VHCWLRIMLVMPLVAGSPHASEPGARAPERVTGVPDSLIPPLARASAHFDAVAATDAYLATVPPAARARSDAYFEGGYWLALWDCVAAIAVYLLILASGLSTRMRNLAARGPRVLEVAAYWAQFIIVTSLLLFPLTAYQDFVREHAYGLATQDFGSWLGDQLKTLGVSIVLGALFVSVVYGVVRRAPRTWWVWGSAASIVFFMFTALIGPLYIDPLFNRYTRLDDPRIRDPILSLARANGITATDIYVMDASRQSTRVSANVSGFLGTERITLNDNLLKRCTLAEIESTMGHEMGHYVLHHVYKSVLFFGIVFVGCFACLRWGGAWALARWGASWRVAGVADVAALPLFAILATGYFFILTPLTNTYTRVEETEADLFGLNAAREPDGEALVDLKLADYRKLDPTPLEEFLFFDHPSGRHRIYAAMRWKAEHLADSASDHQ
jgi:STE24 endopeptidase